MFILNRGYSWVFDKSNPPFGVVTSLSSMPYGQIKRKFKGKSNFKGVQEIFFDPQLYLKQDSYNFMHKVEPSIRSYHWIESEFLDFDSRVLNINGYRSELKKHDFDSYSKIEASIEEKIDECFKFQDSVSVTSLITPTPLIINKNLDFNYYLNWIIKSIDNYKKAGYRQPLYISIPLSEHILSSDYLSNNDFLQAIIDNLTSLDDIVDGFYVTIAREKNEFYITNPKTITNIFELCLILGKELEKKVILNSIDVLGFACLSLGAYSFASGSTTKEKRFNIDDLKDKEITGIPYPKFYSHSLISDLRPYKDLKKLVEINSLDIINNDLTKYSDPLYKSLNTDIDNIIEIDAWEERKNNITTSHKHKVELLVNKTKLLNSLSEKEKIEYVLDWLVNAEKNMNYIKTYFPKIDIPFEHISIWKNCFQNFISTHF
ncbi:MAG: hypothetical protein ACRC1T_17445 [Clostridium chrysemydis]|uniref:hypothetical protein n=1 Tax=Clostridium chrysemydis TaxID=2665504 RepID=UPI003F35C4FF